jgi:hypothetical protein
MKREILRKVSVEKKNIHRGVGVPLKFAVESSPF